MNMKNWGALLGAVAVIGIAGCADRNKNGQPDSPATSSEMKKTMDKAEKVADKALDKAGKAMKNVDDSAMTPKLHAAFAANSALNGTNIDVDSLDAGIILSGTVKSAAQKKLAGEIAKKNAPTYKISNNIRVLGGASPVMNKKPAMKKAN